MSNKEFSIDYVIGDEVKNFEIGKQVYYIKSQYTEQYEYCKECKSRHSVGKETLYYIKPCTIVGFDIDGNHCFSYNTKNSFTLRIKVIDEDDSSKEFNVSETFFTEQEAQERIDKMKEYSK